jgi:NAD(P)-dependent dehydrogenase (short-subunit alcohol dehydrogenase family)
MTGRVMIVTGASSGIGFEIARYLAEGGNDVVLACRNPDKGKAAVARIQAELPNCIVSFMEVLSIIALIPHHFSP